MERTIRRSLQFSRQKRIVVLYNRIMALEMERSQQMENTGGSNDVQREAVVRDYVILGWWKKCS